jgi:hypothetical protein
MARPALGAVRLSHLDLRALRKWGPACAARAAKAERRR